MAKVTAKDIGDIFTKWGVLHSTAVYAEIAALDLEVPVTDVLDRPQEERQVLYRNSHRIMFLHGEVEETDDGWTFELAVPLEGGNGVVITDLPLNRPTGRVISHYGCPPKYRTGPALLRWQIATCANLPVEVIETLAVGDYLYIAEIVGIHANEDFALINS